MEQYKGKFCLERMAKILKVLCSGYYNYLQTEGNRKIDKDLRLITELKSIFAAAKSTYVSPRINAGLKANGYQVSKKRIARLMQVNGIKAKTKGRYRVRYKTQTSPIASNLHSQNFICIKPKSEVGI